MNKKILLSGVKPTGQPHLGNYFGAMRQFVKLQEETEAFIFIADYHALTTVQNKKEMAQNSTDIALDYLAIGLDPNKAVLFKQSDVPEVTELAWIFNCITTVPYLMRAHAYKDAEAKNKEINVGTFDYPMLMASDILIQDADLVPVGQDQKQHVEYARDTAEKFNRIFATELFKMPEALILDEVKTVPGIDGQKMSKSYGNIIPLFATDLEIRDLTMRIVTDSEGETPTNVLAIHSLFRDSEEIKNIYEDNRGKYKKLKEILAEDIISFVRPMREKREELAKDLGLVEKLIKTGGEKARERAKQKMEKVRKAIGTR